MSILQRQVIQSLNGSSDDNLRFLLEMIQRFMKPSENKEENVYGLAMNKKIVSKNWQFRRPGSY